MAKGFQLAQPSHQDWRDAIQRQLGVNAEESFGFAGCQMLLCVEAQPALQLR